MTLPDIIHITESSGFGGAEKYLLDLTAAVQSKGIRVSVALPFNDSNLEFRRRLEGKRINLLHVSQCQANYPKNIANAINFFFT